MNAFIKEIYDHANSPNPSPADPKWLEVQALAFKDDADSYKKLSKLVSDAELTSIRLPVIRTALKDREFTTNGETWKVKQGDTVILDIVRLHGLFDPYLD